MIRRTENGSPFSLRSALADPVIRVPMAPTSTLETDMYAIPEQIARNHIHERHRQAEAWRIRSIAKKARRAHEAEQRAQEAQQAAQHAAHEYSIAIAR
ncbi:MAG TPA: hypothetical protein VFL59_01355 [Candidatus Nanopelagicales bacterium]|nr:hypothetical protein [Candidatus Nanopelagicales bacterium]